MSNGALGGLSGLLEENFTYLAYAVAGAFLLGAAFSLWSWNTGEWSILEGTVGLLFSLFGLLVASVAALYMEPGVGEGGH